MSKAMRFHPNKRHVLAILSMILLASSVPAFAATRSTQATLRTVDARGWHMRVPYDWESYRMWSFDSPFSVVLVTTPSAGTATVLDRPGLEAGQPRADTRIFVSRFRRSGYGSVEWDLSPTSCGACRAPEVAREVQAVELRERWGVLANIERIDGSRTLVLVIENDCYRYTVSADVAAENAASGAELAKGILMGGYVDRSGKSLGRCRE